MPENKKESGKMRKNNLFILIFVKFVPCFTEMFHSIKN